MSHFGPCGPSCYGHTPFSAYPVYPPAPHQSKEEHHITVDELVKAEQFSDYMKSRWKAQEKDAKEKEKKPPQDGVSVAEMWVILLVGCLPMGWLLTTIGRICIQGIQNNMQQLIAPH